MKTPELGRQSMHNCPTFAHWNRHLLNEWAQEAYERLVVQEDTIEQLRLDVKKLLAQLDSDDWR